MNQPQATAAPEPQEITLRFEIKVKQSATLANLTALVEKTKPLITAAGQLGEVEAVALFGRQRWPIV